MVNDARLGTPQAPTFGLDTFGDLEEGPDGEPVVSADAARTLDSMTLRLHDGTVPVRR